MAGLFNILHIGNTGLGASNFGVQVTGQNIANASTPGYHRRAMLQETARPVNRGRFMFSTGVNIVGTHRAAGESLDAGVRNANARASSSGARANTLARTEALFSDLQGGGISVAMDHFFDAFSSLASSPQSTTSRNYALGAAEGVATQIREHAQQIQSMQFQLDRELEVGVTEINRLTTLIHDINQAITRSESPSPDLLDQQAGLLESLSSHTEIVVRHQSNGRVQVDLPSVGFALVSDSSAHALSVQPGANGRTQVFGTEGGGPRNLTAALGGGLGGMVQARDVDLVALQTELDQFAFDFAGAVNSIHSAGFGTDGVTGRNLFTVGAQVAGTAINLSIDPQVSGNPAALAAAQSATLLGDNTQATLMAQLRGNPVIGGETPTEAFSGVLERFGSTLRSAEITAVAEMEGLEHAAQLQQSQTGVSIDEEMTALLQFRQSYAAAAQVIRTADELLTEVLSLKR